MSADLPGDEAGASAGRADEPNAEIAAIDEAPSSVHEYAEDDYDPETETETETEHLDGSARQRGRDRAPDADTDVAAVVDDPDAAVRQPANVKRIVIGLVGLVASLMLLNAGLNILSQPDQSPTSIPPRPRSSATSATTPGSTVTSRSTGTTPGSVVSGSTVPGSPSH